MNTHDIISSINFDRLRIKSTENQLNIIHIENLTSFGNINSNSFIVKINKYPVGPASNMSNDMRIKAAERLLFELITKGNLSEVKKILENLTEISSPLLEKWRKAFCRQPIQKKGKASLEKGEMLKEQRLINKYLKNISSKWIALIDSNEFAINDDLESLKKDLKMNKCNKGITFIKV